MYQQSPPTKSPAFCAAALLLFLISVTQFWGRHYPAFLPRVFSLRTACAASASDAGGVRLDRTFRDRITDASVLPTFNDKLLNYGRNNKTKKEFP